MKVNALIFILASAILSCRSDQEKEKTTQERYEKSKKSVEEIERETPLKFLSFTSRDKHNLIGQTVIKGKIQSKATVVTYKDVVLALDFISKTGTVLRSEEKVVDEFVKPGDETEFKIKTVAPKGADDLRIKIKTASVSKE